MGLESDSPESVQHDEADPILVVHPNYVPAE